MIVGIDFQESLFMHAILHVQDLLSGWNPRSHKINKLHRFIQNYEIYIGDNSDYSQNS